MGPLGVLVATGDGDGGDPGALSPASPGTIPRLMRTGAAPLAPCHMDVLNIRTPNNNRLVAARDGSFTATEVYSVCQETSERHGHKRESPAVDGRAFGLD